MLCWGDVSSFSVGIVIVGGLLIEDLFGGGCTINCGIGNVFSGNLGSSVVILQVLDDGCLAG